jgi:hypothetical protein
MRLRGCRRDPLEWIPTMNKPETSHDAELAELRKRSEELIAEVAKINERIDALAGEVKKPPRGSEGQSITDTWKGP